ncbi:unnamed protein product [Mytilus coruscus]|uniref:Uncharacterized protein n=1 Tax=Mytilus coruscus TaxID=42192 RepID=A0A6J8A2J8_MYTCO|nr:unnamed protein product [Mytilus coruscus]
MGVNGFADWLTECHGNSGKVEDRKEDIDDFKTKTVDLLKEISTRVLVCMLIDFHVGHALRSLKLKESGLSKTDIQWVLAIPACWNSYSIRRLLSTAFKMAGVDDLIIELEPEVTSLFFEYMAVEKGTDDFQRFQPGNKYIVLDCGGDTVNITAHRVQQEKTLHKVVKSSGGVWGDTLVNESFIQLIIRIVGTPVYLDFCEKNAADFVDIFRELEKHKSVFSGEGKTHVTIKMPVFLEETFEKDTGETIQEALRQSLLSGKVTWLCSKIRIHSNLFASFFKESINNIIYHLQKMLRDPKVVGTTNIIMIRRFSESPFLQRKIKEEFPSMNVLIPTEGRLSVLRGAVIFGHNSRAIKC